MIYLDNNATTFLCPHVQEEINSFLSMQYGNPSSVHFFGQRAKGIMINALETCSRYFGCKTNEIIFTSGATEALNMLIRSVPKKSHIITSSLEHAAVLEPLKHTDCSVTYLDPLEGEGAILPLQVRDAIRSDTAMIVLMGANNETGVKTDIAGIAKHAKAHGIVFVVDGVAMLGKEIFDLPEGVSAVCFSGHKIHAPAGIGISVIKKRTKFHPLILGGHQQNNLRGGTENLLGIVAISKAIERLETNLNEDLQRMHYLRDLLEESLQERLKDVVVHGKNLNRICNTSNMAFLGVDGESLLIRLDLEKVAVSHGSACTSGTLGPSRVLLNMGTPPAEARSSIRFSLSRFTTKEEVEKAVEIVTRIVIDLRQ